MQPLEHNKKLSIGIHSAIRLIRLAHMCGRRCILAAYASLPVGLPFWLASSQGADQQLSLVAKTICTGDRFPALVAYGLSMCAGWYQR